MEITTRTNGKLAQTHSPLKSGIRELTDTCPSVGWDAKGKKLSVRYNSDTATRDCDDLRGWR